jgi:hypothetical protein
MGVLQNDLIGGVERLGEGRKELRPKILGANGSFLLSLVALVSLGVAHS